MQIISNMKKVHIMLTGGNMDIVMVNHMIVLAGRMMIIIIVVKKIIVMDVVKRYMLQQL